MTKISGVSERDIDLLILEEFISSRKFQKLFLDLVLLKDKSLKFIQAQRSVTDSTGESDLEVTFEDKNNNRYILLIENKVNANFQKEQLNRYVKRGENYIKHSKAIAFNTILVAPQSYYNNDLKGFDFRINYEKIVDYFSSNHELGERKKYKILLLNSAIEKSTSGYQMEADASVTNFWKDYWELSLDAAKEFYMDEPGNKPSSSSFIYFRNVHLPKDIDFVHKVTHGYFDLQFKGMGNDISKMREKYSDFLQDNMKIVKAGKSASIRISVPKLSLADTVESQKEKVIQCFNEGQNLLKWFEQNKIL